MELDEGNPHETCSVHCGRNKEFYCADHDAFYCSVCVFKLHKECSSILAPDEVETFISEYKVLLDSDIERLQTEVSKLLNEMMGAYDRVISTKTKTEEAIKTLRNSIDKQLNRLQKNTSTTMDYALKQELPKYQKEIEDLRSIQNDLSSSAGLLSTSVFSDQNDSKKTIEHMRSLILQKKRFHEIDTKVKIKGEKHTIDKHVAFKESVQVQDVLKTLSKLEQFGMISVRHVAESKKDTNVATLSFDTEANVEIMLNTNGICTNDTANKLNNVVYHGEGEGKMCTAIKESTLDTDKNAEDSCASGSRPHFGENQWKSIEPNFRVGGATKNASLETVNTLQIHQTFVEELRSKVAKQNVIDSEIIAISSGATSEASQSVLHLGEGRGQYTRSDLDVTGEPNDAIMVHNGTPNVPRPRADELISNVRGNTPVEEEGTMGCFALRQKIYTIVGRGDKTVGNMNTKRSRSLPVFHNRTRRQNKEVVVIEDDGSVHILMAD